MTDDLIEERKKENPEPRSFLTGWICPKCGRVFSPFERECPYCGPATIWTTTSMPITFTFDPNWKNGDAGAGGSSIS